MQSKSKSHSYKSLLSDPIFIKIWIAFFISRIGMWMSRIAASFLLYDTSNSSIAIGSLWIIIILPNILFGPFIGVLINKYNPIKSMFIIEISRSILLISLIFLPKSYIYIVFFLQSSLGIFFNGAYQKIFPILFKKNLLSANSLQEIGLNIATTIGPFLAGLVYKFYGPKISFFADGISFAIAAVLILYIPSSIFQKRKDSENNNYWTEFVDGFKIIINNNIIKNLTLMSVISSLGWGAYAALLVVFCRDALNLGVDSYGLLYSSNTAGGLVGFLVITIFGTKYISKAKGRYIVISFFIISVATFFFALSGNLVIAMIVLFIEGIFLIILNIAEETLFQEIISDDFRGRVFCFTGAMNNTSMILSIVVGSFLGEIIGIRIIYLFIAFLAFLATLIGYRNIFKIH